MREMNVAPGVSRSSMGTMTFAWKRTFRFIQRATGARVMRDILKDVGIDPASQCDVTDVRMHTTTSLFPYLKAI